jgi:hypothetical protein
VTVCGVSLKIESDWIGRCRVVLEKGKPDGARQLVWGGM